MTDRQFQQDIRATGIGGRGTGQASFGLAGAHRCALHHGAARVLNSSTNASCDLLRAGAQTCTEYCQQAAKLLKRTMDVLLLLETLSRLEAQNSAARKSRREKPDTESAAIIGTRVNRSIIGKEYSLSLRNWASARLVFLCIARLSLCYLRFAQPPPGCANQ